MSSIHTLIPDIYALLKEKGVEPYWNEVSQHLPASTEKYNGGGKLRMSKLGPICPRALWFSYHHPELAEPLPAWAVFKLSYGHMVEALALTLAKAAGHKVEGEQDEINLDDISGHRDAVIDGCIVDCKSANSRAFLHFKARDHHYLDRWGYLPQLDAYVVGSANDPKVTTKDRGYLWAIDKSLGHMVLYEHFINDDRNRGILDRIRTYKEIVSRTTPPACSCGTVAEGKSGNIGLDVQASYSAYKWECFPHLRCFLYAGQDGVKKPVYLTKVVRKPDVTEVDKYGNTVYR